MDLQTATSANPDDMAKMWNEVAAERADGAIPTADKPLDQPTLNADAATIVQDQNEDKGASSQADNTVNADAQAAATPAAQSAEEAKPDLVKELAEKVGKLEGQLRNVNGHIGGLTAGQREMREMLTVSKSAAETVKDAPTQAQVKQAMQNPQEWDALREDFPEWATATEKLLDARLSGLQPQAASMDQEAIDKIVAERVAAATAQQRAEMIDSRLDEIVDGDWKAEVKSEPFGKWLQAQPGEVKALAESANLADASKMLRLYSKSKQSNPTQQIIDQRNARLENGVTVKRGLKSQPAKAPEDMTETELWNYEAAQREKARARG